MQYRKTIIHGLGVKYRTITEPLFEELDKNHEDWDIKHPSLKSGSINLLHYSDDIFYYETPEGDITVFGSWREEDHIALALDINIDWQRDIVEEYILRRM